jgi:hypothetical protein
MAFLAFVYLVLESALNQLHKLWQAVFYCQNAGSEQYVDDREDFVVFFPEAVRALRRPRQMSSISYEARSFSTSRSAAASMKPEPQSSDDDSSDNDSDNNNGSHDDQAVAGPSQMDRDLRNVTPVPDDDEAHENTSCYFRHPDGMIEIQIHRARGRMHPIPQG